jgi:hypothetical protein
VSNGLRTYKASQRPPYYTDSSRIAEQLKGRGIVIGACNEFLSKGGQEALLEASDLVLGMSRQTDVQDKIGAVSKSKKDYLVPLVPWDHKHSANSPLLRVAIDDKLLEIVSLYLGMWPRLHAIGAWLNFPSADPPKQSQLWHRDPEDLKLVKAFIYLVDVDENRGPFCYIPQTHPFGPKAALVPKHDDPKRIADHEMAASISSDSWISCTGPAKTMILADTVGYHRGGKPTVGNRILITFTYTSGAPHDRRILRVDGKPSAVTAMQHYAL